MNINNHDKPRSPATLIDRLRALVPAHPTTPAGALRTAGGQADALRADANSMPLRLPEDLITELPDLRVESTPHAPATGIAYRDIDTGQWVLAVRDDLPDARRRTCLLYAVKFYLDHLLEDRLYGNDPLLADAYQHAAAHHFATRVVAHPRAVDLILTTGVTNIDHIAQILGLDPDTTQRHLTALGHLGPDGHLHRTSTNPERSYP